MSHATNERVKELIAKMTLKNNYWGYLFGRIRRKPSKSIPSIMGVAPESDGTISLLYQPDLVDGTDDDMLTYVIEHEGMHVLNKHVPRLLRVLAGEMDMKKKQEKCEVWGLAADGAVNQLTRIPKMLKIGGMDWPTIFPENLELPRNKPVEWYYDELLKKHEKNKKDCKNKGGKQPGVGDMFKPDSDQGNNGEQSNNGKSFDDHQSWKDIVDKVADPQALSRKIDSYVQDIIRDSLKNFAKNRGNLPGYIEELIREALMPPKAPYYQIIRKLIRGTRLSKFKRAFTRINRKRTYVFGLDNDDALPAISPFPGKKRDRTFGIVVLIDTSGSMSRDEILEGLSGIKNIIENDRHCKVTVLEVDTEVAKEYELNRVNDIQFNIKGRGGTTLFPGLQRAKELACDVVLAFTDGGCENINEINRKRMPKKIIWVLSERDSASCIDRTGYIVRI